MKIRGKKREGLSCDKNLKCRKSDKGCNLGKCTEIDLDQICELYLTEYCALVKKYENRKVY